MFRMKHCFLIFNDDIIFLAMLSSPFGVRRYPLNSFEDSIVTYLENLISSRVSSKLRLFRGAAETKGFQRLVAAVRLPVLRRSSVAHLRDSAMARCVHAAQQTKFVRKPKVYSSIK